MEIATRKAGTEECQGAGGTSKASRPCSCRTETAAQEHLNWYWPKSPHVWRKTPICRHREPSKPKQNQVEENHAQTLLTKLLKTKRKEQAPGTHSWRAQPQTVPDHA